MCLLPRWVCSHRVDSAAMMSAAKHFIHHNPEMWDSLGINGHLTCVNHVVDPSRLPEPSPTWYKNIDCPLSNVFCQRCREGRAGYTFRWASPLWLDQYCAMARKGAWMPGDPEIETFEEARGYQQVDHLGQRRACGTTHQALPVPFT